MPSAPVLLSPSAAPPADEAPVTAGVLFAGASTSALQHSHWQLMEQLRQLGLASLVDTRVLPARARDAGPARPVLQVVLRPTLIEHWTPGHDTRQLARTLALDSRHADDLAREIIVALLASPQAQVFPSHEEWAAALRVRQRIVQTARATRLNPDPEAPRRPPEDWLRDPAQGPRLRPGRPLHLALQTLLHPAQGPGYALSPYRATEYVLLLALAEETRHHHPVLHQGLQRRFEQRPLRDCEFHQVLMRQIGHPDAPLPCGFAVPGDRLWLRPPPARALVWPAPPAGGRWAIYLGQGEYREFDSRPSPSRQPPWSSPEHSAAWQPMREFPRLLCPGSSDIVL